MIKQILFNNQVEIGISENIDGNMRFFSGSNESEIIKNQKKLGELIKTNNVARIRTIYDKREQFTKYAKITRNNFPKYSIDNPEENIPVSDGLITKEPGIGILLPLADCLGVVVFDEKRKILGLLHAGRQNIEQDGPRKFIKYFVDSLGSNVKDLKLYFSPYALNYHIFKLDKNLGKAAKEQFLNIGISPSNITDYEIDTVNNINFPSYSNSDTFKRFAIIAKIV